MSILCTQRVTEEDIQPLGAAELSDTFSLVGIAANTEGFADSRMTAAWLRDSPVPSSSVELCTGRLQASSWAFLLLLFSLELPIHINTFTTTTITDAFMKR